MLKLLVIAGLWKNGALIHGGHGIRLSIYVPANCYYVPVGKAPPRSYFGVDNYPEDEKCVPFTFENSKKIVKVNARESFLRRTSCFMYPYSLNVTILTWMVRASLRHRMTRESIAACCLTSQYSTKLDVPACVGVGRTLARMGKEADVYTTTYRCKDNQKFEGRLRALVQAIIDNGIAVQVYV